VLPGLLVAAYPEAVQPVGPPPGDRPTVSLLVTASDEAELLPMKIDACTGVEHHDGRLGVVVCHEAPPTEGTPAVPAAAAGDPRVTTVERPAPPAGKASATNHGLRAASGEVVGVLDADQRPEPDAVARAVHWLAEESVWCVEGRCPGTNPGDSPVAPCVTGERGIVERTEFVARDRLDGFAIFTGGRALLRADALDAVGPFDEFVLRRPVRYATS
jgi:cellulose synthase/poly-beta-1,6-N-acetylglucosamine synthase-like glycosyltransferase